MTQIKEDIDGNEQERSEEDIKASATDKGSDREKKSIDLDKIYNWCNQILVYIAGFAAIGGFISDGMTANAPICVAIGAIAGAAVGIISEPSYHFNKVTKRALIPKPPLITRIEFFHIFNKLVSRKQDSEENS